MSTSTPVAPFPPRNGLWSNFEEEPRKTSENGSMDRQNESANFRRSRPLRAETARGVWDRVIFYFTINCETRSRETVCIHSHGTVSHRTCVQLPSNIHIVIPQKRKDISGDSELKFLLSNLEAAGGHITLTHRLHQPFYTSIAFHYLVADR
jgi:hypothetical protein